MKKLFLVIQLSFGVIICQGQLTCESNMVNTQMTSTEMCILDCLKQFSFDKYLQKNNLSFFDSALNCSNKEIVFLHETKQKHLVVAFLFTPDLQVRFYFKKFSHIDQRTPLGKLKRIIVGKEVPYKVRIFHSVNVICTSSGS